MTEPIQYPLETVKDMIKTQYQLTTSQVATFCAELCDKNRGNLSIGDMIRKQFNIIKESTSIENLSIGETISEESNTTAVKEPEQQKKTNLRIIK